MRISQSGPEMHNETDHYTLRDFITDSVASDQISQLRKLVLGYAGRNAIRSIFAWRDYESLIWMCRKKNCMLIK